ncbi:signal peptidase I [Paenibacillus wulumuqiensis]|uniref:signal peptidase I n=1 Tax=Paenibacillus wulumuqiensis TaxID=1567107 RepID=UPI0009E6413B|nr:signal peptidase I [Paenibacillus wulumuqiensis]
MTQQPQGNDPVSSAEPDTHHPTSSSTEHPPKSKKSEVKEWLIGIIVAVCLISIVRLFLFEPFVVSGQSMEPNFHNDERLIANKLLYDLRSPQPGEVIVLKVPSQHRDFIKRVIAVGGDTVKVEGDRLMVNGKAVDEPYIQSAVAAAQAQGSPYNINDFPTPALPDGKVPEGYLFVMGDNRSHSQDSRMIGYIPVNDVVGRAEMIYWPFSHFHWIQS